ncbi:MAG: hypothetical protein SXA11_14795 [Cyanobacteriota bacterium]|nr:hypothetical protein [Cyanobacteriota bacterium]
MAKVLLLVTGNRRDACSTGEQARRLFYGGTGETLTKHPTIINY